MQGTVFFSNRLCIAADAAAATTKSQPPPRKKQKCAGYRPAPVSIHSQFCHEHNNYLYKHYFVLQMIINMKECRVQAITHSTQAPDAEPEEEEQEEEQQH